MRFPDQENVPAPPKFSGSPKKVPVVKLAAWIEEAMVKKSVDSRVNTLIKNCVQTKHRSFFVIVGDRGKEQVTCAGFLQGDQASYILTLPVSR